MKGNKPHKYSRDAQVRVALGGPADPADDSSEEEDDDYQPQPKGYCVGVPATRAWRL